TGRGGITPPTGNNGFPAQYVCNDGTSAGTSLTSSSCSANSGVWFPDFRKDEPSIRLAIMVKFEALESMGPVRTAGMRAKQNADNVPVTVRCCPLTLPRERSSCG